MTVLRELFTAADGSKLSDEQFMQAARRPKDSALALAASALKALLQCLVVEKRGGGEGYDWKYYRIYTRMARVDMVFAITELGEVGA